MKSTIVVSVLLVALGSLAGCASRAIKEGLGVALGAKGQYAQIQSLPSNETALAEYRNFELGDFTDATGGRAPRQLWTLLPTAFDQELADKRLPREAGGKTLVARGKIIYYEDSNLMGNVFGPFEEVIALVELVDKSSGRVLASSHCVGRTDQTVNRGVQKKAEGLAKGIVAWLDKHYPQANRTPAP